MNFVESFAMMIVIALAFTACKEEETTASSDFTVEVGGSTYTYIVPETFDDYGEDNLVISTTICFEPTCYNSYSVEGNGAPFDELTFKIASAVEASKLESLAGQSLSFDRESDVYVELSGEVGSAELVMDTTATNVANVTTVKSLGENDGYYDFELTGDFDVTLVNASTEETLEVKGTYELPLSITVE
ncbi:hypothetical protein [Marinoscillum furvescens]|nr:hypothetical protein [Marinoscillum furvescens]